jgi:hypothetical protein
VVHAQSGRVHAGAVGIRAVDACAVDACAVGICVREICETGSGLLAACVEMNAAQAVGATSAGVLSASGGGLLQIPRARRQTPHHASQIDPLDRRIPEKKVLIHRA